MSTIMSPRPLPQVGAEQKSRATRIVVSSFGALAALMGIEHGIGEILQGPLTPSSAVIESWPNTAGFEILSGEPALTLVPHMVITGVLAIIAALAVGVWSIWFIERPHGGLILIGLSMLLLLVGGGFGPPLVTMITGVAAMRIGGKPRREPGSVLRAMAKAWPWLLGAGLFGYLGLVPGMVVVSRATGFDNPYVVSGLMLVAFAGLLLALVAARVQDNLAANSALIRKENV
jgi:hypothetical protein